MMRKVAQKIRRDSRPFQAFTLSLLGMSLLSVLMFAWGVARGEGYRDWYLLWNLLLAWIPMVLAYALVRRLRHHVWSSWSAIALTLGWLLFLPNSFYMVSDYIHLEDMARSDVLFDALVFTMFILNALILGFTSLYLVQAELRKRLSAWQTELIAGVLLLVCSFAIYLGRELRWNSWDVLLNPAGIIFDISERILDPFGHPKTFEVTAIFFVFLGGLYWALGGMVRAIAAHARQQDD